MSLFDAAKKGDNNLAKELIKDKNVDINETNQNGETPLTIALMNDLDEFAKLLINKGADVNKADKKGNTPLFTALGNELNEVCKLLISKGADVNQVNKNGETPLSFSIMNLNYKIAIVLLEKGVDVNKADNKGNTPIMVAIRKSLDKMCELLISKGADVNQADKHGETPLFIASQNGLVELCELLISKGANLNQSNKHKITPLYIAISEGNNSVSNLLISKGADVNQPNKNGETPLTVALENKNREIIDLLLASGATTGPDFDYQNAPGKNIKKNLEDFKKSVSPVKEEKSPRTAYDELRTNQITMLGTKHGELFKIKINHPNIFELFQNYRNLSKHPKIDCGLQVLFSLGLRDINASKHNSFVINKLSKYKKASGIGFDDFVEYLIKIFDLHEETFITQRYTPQTICAYLNDKLLEGHSSILFMDFDKTSHFLVTFKYEGIVFFFDPQKSSYGTNEQHAPAIFRCDEISDHYDSRIEYFFTIQLNPHIEDFEDKPLQVDKCNLPMFAKGKVSKKLKKKLSKKAKKKTKSKKN